MRVMKNVFDFYLDASIHVASSIIALIQITAITLNITVPLALNIFIFFGSISCYNFVKYGVEAEKYILVANNYHKNIQFFSLGCLLIALFQLFHLSETVFIGLLVLGAITGLYALPVLPNHKNFRSFSGFKILIVAVVWAGTTVILPVLASSLPLTWDVWIETAQRFLLVLILMVPFEIRDLKFDGADLKTLPQRLGITRTKSVGVIWVALFLLLSFMIDDEPFYALVSKIIISVILILVLLRTKMSQNRYFSSFWVEAIPVFWLGFLLLSKTYF